ncbi:MAG: TIM barrel protein [Mariniphaga sp.]
MDRIIFLRISLICSLFLFAFPVLARKKITNVFYVQNTLSGFKNAPHDAFEKAKLLKATGYDGLEGSGTKDFSELKSVLDHNDLQMPVNYVALNFEAEGKVENPSIEEIKAMIRVSPKGSVIYFPLHSNKYKDDKIAGDLVVAEILRKLSDFAVNYKVRLCVYPHVSLYCETLSHNLMLAKMVSRKNFGCTINLCHLLKLEGPEDIEKKIKEMVPYLFAVNICGADKGNTRQLGWDQLIQPLGQGSFDTYAFVKILIDNGYKGPIGLQCYNLKGDATETLKQSMQTWKAYKVRYLNEQKYHGNR